MRLVADAAALSQAIQAVQASAGKVNGVDIALLNAANGVLSIAASNNASQSHFALDAKIDADGACCMNVIDLASVARQLPKNGDVAMELKGTDLEIVTERSRFRLGALDQSLFIPWTQAPDCPFDVIQTEGLVKAIEGVLHAAAADSGGMVQLTGVLLTDHGGSVPLRAVATDGHRLACRIIKGQGPALPPEGIVIPAKTCKEIARLATGLQTMEFRAKGPILEIGGGPERMLAKLIDSNYPDYRPLLDGNPPGGVELDRKTLLEAATRIGSLLSKSPIMRFLVDDKGIHLRADREQVGGMETVVAIETRPQDRIEIGLNHRYLCDALKAIQAPVVRISYEAPHQPIRIGAPQDPDGEQIIMPARL
jgi:DNA polymerase-3 subunit beta